MRKIVLFFVLLSITFPGCINKETSKQKYYEQGIRYFQGGNTNGAIIAFKKAIEKDQNYFEARYQLGLAYHERKKYDSAEREFLKVLRLNPSFKDTHIALAKAYINKSKIDDAIKEINIYLNNKNDNPEAFEVAAKAYVAKGDYSSAEEFVGKALQIAPGRTTSKTILSDIYLAEGKIDQADALIKEVLAEDGKNREALYLLVKIRQKQGRVEDTINAYQRIIEIDPNDINAHLEIGLAYLQSKKIEEAMKTAEKMKALRKDNAEALYLMGLVNFHQRKIDDAIDYLQKSLKLRSFPAAHYFTGLCRLEKGDMEQATSEFQKVVDMDPGMIQAHILLAVTHLKAGRVAEAEKEAKRALSIDAKNALAHNVLGSAYFVQNRGEMAEEEFDKAIELNPEFVDAHIKKGAFNLQIGNDQVAEREFMSAVKIAPELLNSRIILAKYYIRNQKYHEAINVLRQGLKGDGNDSVIYNVMGAAYLGAGDTDNSKQSFEKAKSSDPKFFLPYFNLALFYLNKGEKEMAIKEYRKVLDVDGNNITALLMLAKIMEAEKKDKEALSYYMKAKETGKAIAYLSLAAYYQNRNDNKQAMNILQEALNVDPGNIQVREMIGLLHVTDKNYKEALVVYKDLKKSSPEIGAEMTANVYEAMGEYDRALSEIKGILPKDAGRIDILSKMVALYIKKKDFAYAEITAKEIISMKPDGDAGYLILASVYMDSNQFTEALNALKKAQELNPRNTETKTAIGKVYMSVKDFQKALEIFRGIERENPEYAPAYFYQASIHEYYGQKKDAVERYKKTLEHAPNYVLALNNLAYLYSEGYGPVDQAVEMASKAKKLTPGDGSITDTLGWALYKTGKYDEALKYFIEATHYLPGEPAIRYHLAHAYLKKGMEDKAEEQLKNSIRLGRIYPFNEFKDAQQMLAGMGRK